jgi:hypothetical protein
MKKKTENVYCHNQIKAQTIFLEVHTLEKGNHNVSLLRLQMRLFDDQFVNNPVQCSKL